MTRPVSLWMLAAIIGIAVGISSLAGTTSPETRDFMACHGSIPGTRAL
jgi:hypothetical protein